MGKIEAKVEKIIKKFETSDPFKIADQLGISVLYEDLGSVMGYYSKAYRMKIIHINENANEKQQLFVCAHELGHAVLHPDHNTSFLKSYTYYSPDIYEKEANNFAIELLFNHNFEESLCRKQLAEEFLLPNHLLK